MTSIGDEPLVDFKSFFEEFEAQWRERLGGTGKALSRDLRMLTDLMILHQTELIDERVKQQVASWALANSDEKIPLDKISKDGLLALLTNQVYISNGEIMEMLKLRFPDFP